MGILKNLVNAKVSGNVGSMNFRKRGSQTVVAERSYSNSSKGNGATEAQRLHRSRLANIVNFYRVIAAIQARAWQNKPENTSDFNMLSKYNLAASPIFLTKQEAVAGACVIAPYEVSRGALNTLKVDFLGNRCSCGVLVGAGLNMQQNSLGSVSQAIIDNNEGWRNGDKLSVALLAHSLVEVAGIMVPKVVVNYVEITLDVESNVNFLHVPTVAAATPMVDDDGYLCFGKLCNAAFAVHSRKISGILETSSQVIVMSNPNDTLFKKYSGETQIQAAMASYGYQSDVLLTPGNVAESNPADAKVAVLESATYGGTPIVDGATIQGGQDLLLTGVDMTTRNVAVTCNGIKFVPTATTATTQQFALFDGGTLTIAVNGAIAYTLTVTPAPVNINNFRFGGNTYVTSVSNLSHVGAGTVNLSVTGTSLGEITASGATVTNKSGDGTNRVADIVFTNADYNFTVSCGGRVIISGHNSLSSAGGGQSATGYQLSLYRNPNAGGTVEGAGKYDAGTMVTIKATPNAGYLFDCWSDRNADNPRNITISGALSLTAWFYKEGEPKPSESDDDDYASAS